MITADCVTWLRDMGAEDIAHPGGTLFDHLVRVHDQLTEWGAERPVRVAGLCHALYGTDGFPVVLADLDRRAEVADRIGADAEELVYFYASCDRRATYRGVAAGADFADRFTGTRYPPDPAALRAFAEITVANELDVVRANPLFDEIDRAGLYDLFASWRPLLSASASADVERVLR